MYMSLADLREKFINDNTFAQQFVKDAREVGVTVDILKHDNTGALDEELLYGNTNLLNTYVNVVQKIITEKPSGATRRLASYIHAPFYREEDFYIDPDTRTISVPPAFNKNGVAVVGDHLAELLFFNMPRFFDVVDLYSCKIYIYWKNTGLRDYAEPHMSEPIAVYPEGDNLHFGWYLTEEATDTAGQIEFAVEFIIRDEVSGEVTFRLYTQPAKITVKNAIDIDTNGVMIDPNREDLIFSRAIYSNVVNLLTAAPAVITKNLPTGDLNMDPETGTITLSVDALIPSEEEETNKLILGWNWNGVMVEQPSGSTINDAEHLVGIETYELEDEKLVQFSDPVGATNEVTYNYEAIDEPDDEADPSELHWYEFVEDEYVLTEDTEVDNEKTYYSRVEVPAEGTAVTYKTLKTNVPGLYQVYVGNVVTDPSSENYGGIRYVYSNVAKIAAASEITVNNKEMPAMTYLDNWQNRDPVMTAYIEGANGNVVCYWKRLAPGETDESNAVILNPDPADQAAVEVLENGEPTGIYKSVYDPTGEGEATKRSNRGWYWVEALNIKNNTIKRAESKPRVFVELTPEKIPNIIVEELDRSTHTFKVKVPQEYIQHEDLVYELAVNIRSYYVVNGEEKSKETPVTFDNLSVYKYFNAKSNGNNGETVFTLGEGTIARASLTAGAPYALFVSVVPIAQRGNAGMERYATKADDISGTIVPNRTYQTLETIF